MNNGPLGLHMQQGVDNWTQALTWLPNRSPIKVISGHQRLAQAQQIGAQMGKRFFTVYRHHVEEQPMPTGNYTAAALAYLKLFVDESFYESAPHIEAIQHYNEFYANGMSTSDRQHWINFERAMVDVWAKFRQQPELAHIDLILAEAAVGNDVPFEICKLAQDIPWVWAGYHGYVPVYKGIIRPDHAQYYSLRIASMEHRYGLKPKWFMGEWGAVGHSVDFDPSGKWPNALAPNDGWKHEKVYNGNLDAFLAMTKEWLIGLFQTKAWIEGRFGGAVLFTSGDRKNWRWFDTTQPDLNWFAKHVAQVTAEYGDKWKQAPPKPPEPRPPVVTPPPATPPPVTVPEGKPRTQYKRRYMLLPPAAPVALWEKVAAIASMTGGTLGQSADDAGLGALAHKTVVLVNFDDAMAMDYKTWFAMHYPGTIVERLLVPLDPEPEPEKPELAIADLVDALPKHEVYKYKARDLNKIEYLVIHHTAAPYDRGSYRIAQYHVFTQGWPGIGYHYMVGHGGQVEQVNRLETMSYHIGDLNHLGIGICLHGDFTNEVPSEMQIEATIELLKILKKRFPNAKVVGHYEVGSTACPGKTRDSWLPRIKAAVQ